jgi:predicted  nucleic acid-binding Zn-ribbon protein
MSDTANDLKIELKKGLSQLQTLRDEVRVKLHLANMDLKDQWNKLEPHLADVEKKAADATEASRNLINEAVKKLEKFRSSLQQ